MKYIVLDIRFELNLQIQFKSFEEAAFKDGLMSRIKKFHALVKCE